MAQRIANATAPTATTPKMARVRRLWDSVWVVGLENWESAKVVSRLEFRW
jgi:hypothetical protein